MFSDNENLKNTVMNEKDRVRLKQEEIQKEIYDRLIKIQKNSIYGDLTYSYKDDTYSYKDDNTSFGLTQLETDDLTQLETE